MTISVATIGGNFNLADQTSYTTASFTVTSGRPTYAFVHGHKSAGDHLPPTVTCSNGDSLTLLCPPPALTWTGQANKQWVFGFIPTSGGSFTFTFDWSGVTMLQSTWSLFDATGLHTSDGIWGTVINDSTRFPPVSYPNGSAHVLNVQEVWDAQNAVLQCGIVGSPTVTVSPSGGATLVDEQQSSGSGTTTMYVGYLIGGAATVGYTWSGSFSSFSHGLELRASGTSAPPLSAEILGTPIHSTTGGTAITHTSVSPVANSLLILCAAAGGTLRTVSSITGTLGGTWTQVGSTLQWDTVGTPTQYMRVYQQQIGGSPGSGTVVVNYSGVTGGDHLVIVQITGQDATTGVVQNGTNRGDAGTAVSASLSAFGHVNNGTLAFYGSDPSGAGDNLEGPGFEELNEGSFSTPSSELTTIWRHSNDTTPTATLPSALDWAMFALEVKGASAGATDLVIQNASHSQTAENVALTQEHALVVADATHAQAAESFALAQVHVLAIDAATHAHVVENVALAVAGSLGIQDASHAHTAANVDLAQVHVLAIDAGSHAHIVESLALVVALAIADASHSHAAENVALTQAHALTIDAAVHAHTAENVTLAAAGDLVIQSGTHAHTADNVVLTQEHALTIQDATHGHTAQNVVLSIEGSLAIADATHAHTATNLDLTQVHTLVIQAATHGHSAENVALAVNAVDLVIANAAHGHTATNLALAQVHALFVSDANHAHTADGVSITQVHLLVIQGASHAHTAENVVLSLGAIGFPVPSPGRAVMGSGSNQAAMVGGASRATEV